jgi:hypothetical protein
VVGQPEARLQVGEVEVGDGEQAIAGHRGESMGSTSDHGPGDGLPAAANAREPAGDEEQHDGDDRQPHQAVNHESQNRQDNPDDQQSNDDSHDRTIDGKRRARLRRSTGRSGRVHSRLGPPSEMPARKKVEFYDQFADRHRAMLAEQEAGAGASTFSSRGTEGGGVHRGSAGWAELARVIM